MFSWKNNNFLSVLFVIALSKHKKITTVKSWGFKWLRWESVVEGSNQVKSVYFNICRGFYNNRNSTQSQGAVKNVVDKYISGTTVIKKKPTLKITGRRVKPLRSDFLRNI